MAHYALAEDQQQGDALGDDSFLDIVANMVGILIILVMVVGVRIKNVRSLSSPTDQSAATVEPETVSRAEAQAAVQALQESLLNEQGMRNEIGQLLLQSEELKTTVMIQRDRRSMYALAVADEELKIKQREASLDRSRRETFDLSRRITELESEREKVTDEIERIDEATEKKPTVLYNHPTPLGRKQIDRDEVFFQLHGGRLAYIPIKQLIKLRNDAFTRQRDTILQRGELSETVGPIRGFRLASTINITRERDPRSGMTIIRQYAPWTLHPVDQQLGESIESALLPGSEFMAVLMMCKTGSDTITVWTYPDSFAEFREVQAYLSKRGFAVAARPLPEGFPIGGSPLGNRSIAQ